MSGEQANPELDRILAELSGYTAAANATHQPVTTAPPLPHPTHASQARHQQSIPYHVSTSTLSQDFTPKATVSLPVQDRGTPFAQKPSTPDVDPSTIFEWRTAIRCVNKISASNPQFGTKVKEMIADQERNVKQWWEDRNNLINTQKTKNEGRRNLNLMLKEVGGKPEPESTPEQDKAEMDRFDKKVYGASQQMNKVHEAEMKRLGVPFFGVDPKYVVRNGLEQTTAARDALSQAMITEAELLDLQRKMIQHLEDLYRD